MPGSPRPFPALARALTRAAGPPALLLAGPPFAALGLFSAVIFGGNGMRPHDLCAVLAANAAARAALWGTWLLVTAPAARALLAPRDTFLLRTLPVPPWQFWLVHGAHLALLQAPWLLLFAVGAGPVTGLAHAIAAAGASALVTARPVMLREIAAAIALAAAIGLGAPSALLLAVALPAGAAGVAGAWTRAPERSARAGASIVTGSAPVALALAHLAVLARRDAIVLVRGALASLVGALVLVLAVRNNAVAETADRDSLAIACGAIPLALATAGSAVKVLETERRLAWLLLSTGTPPRLRALAAAAITAAWGAVAGALYGSLAGARVVLLGVLLGASLGGVAAHVARRAEQPSGPDGTAVTAGMALAAIATMVLGGTLGAASLALIASLSLLLVLATPRILTARERRSEFEARMPWSPT